MKRSAQVALVLMGVTGTTAAGAYMMPPRPECRAQPAASTALGPPAALPQKAAQEEPCRRRSRSWGSWHWGSNYSAYSSSDPSRPWYARRAPTSVSTALSGNRSGSTSTSTSAPRSGSTSTTGTSRGGFGSTGHSMSGHSGGS
jgi:hypothetical protein